MRLGAKRIPRWSTSSHRLARIFSEEARQRTCARTERMLKVAAMEALGLRCRQRCFRAPRGHPGGPAPMSALAPKVGHQLERTNAGASSFLLLRPGAIGPMESARYQGYERRGASSAFQRVIWNIKRQNIFVCFSDVTHVTIHGTPLTCDLRLRCSWEAA